MNYSYQPAVEQISYETATSILETKGYRIVRQGVNADEPAVVNEVRQSFQQIGVDVKDFALDHEAFLRYQQEAAYAANYPEYYGTRLVEKQVEHFVTLELLHLTESDVFIDIASENSPVPDIYARITKAQTYSQDIQYAPGLNGRRIGGDACAMPLNRGFATAAALTCSLEHFEADADRKLFEELARVLRPGGRIVVAPLYMFPEAVTQTDPAYSAQVAVPFDPGVTLYCAEGWGNRHARFYSPQSLQERVLTPLSSRFAFEIHLLSGFEGITGNVYLRYVLVGTRKVDAGDENYNDIVPRFDPTRFPTKLNLGCGSDRRDGFLNVDFNAFNKPDLVADVRDLSILPSDCYDEIVAQDVLEHLPRTSTASALREWNRLLKTGGRLHLRVPSLEGLWGMFRDKPTFAKQARLMQNLFGTQAYTGDFHFTSFTRILLEGYLQRTGFKVERMGTLDGWLFDCTARKISNTGPSADIQHARLFEIPDNHDFLGATYRLLLRREPDQGGFAYYYGAISAGHLTRQQVIDILLGSPEYEQLTGGSGEG